MAEEKYSPDFMKMELGEVQGAAKAAKNMTDRRFKRFEADVQEVIDEGRYNKDNHQVIKDLKREMVEDIVKYEDILTYLDGVYTAKAEKYTVEISEMTKNFEVIAQRRSIMREKIKEAVAAIEEERNKYDQLRTREDRTLTGSQRGGGGGEKQFNNHRAPTRTGSLRNTLR